MMRLSTLPILMADSLVRVHWSTGLARNGYVDVKVATSSKDKETLAELIAIRHLLYPTLFTKHQNSAVFC